MGQAWDRLGIGLGQAWDRLGTGLEQAWDRLGTALGQAWDSVGAALGPHMWFLYLLLDGPHTIEHLDGHMGRQILDRVGRSVAFLAPSSGQAMTLWILMVTHAVGLGLIMERL